MFLAASTHADEEQIIADAHAILRAKLPALLTIIVPRHPERGRDIATRLRAKGFDAPLRSQMTAVAFDGTDLKSGLLIADTLGELGTWFALSPIAFIGKSLSSDGGGHNPIEAVRHGTAVLTGPAVANFEVAYKTLFAVGGAVKVTSAADIAEQVSRLLADSSALAALNSQAEAAFAKLSGALPKTIAALVQLLPAAAVASAASAFTAPP